MTNNLRQNPNIEWWDHQVPDLSNLISGEGPSTGALKPGSEWHSELSGFVNSSNLATINGVAERCNNRIAAGLPAARPTSFWVVSGLVGIALIVATVLIINHTDEPTDQEAISQNTPPAVQLDKETGTTNDGDQPESNTGFGPHVADNDSPEQTDEDWIAPEDGTTSGDAAQHNDFTMQPADDPTPHDPLPEDSDQSGTSSGQASADRDEPTDQASGSGTDPGFRLTNTGHKTATRDASIPLSLQEARVAMKTNYWVHLQATERSHGTQGGQLSSSSGETSEVEFSVSDMPSYVGGDDKMIEDLTYFVRQAALDGEYETPESVMAIFLVDPKGNLKNIQVYGSKSSEIKKAVRMALNKLVSWKKGKKSGKKGTIRYEISLSFN